ncbi:hypothetical protein E2C01_076372 [Portunus trituberculatus]|uniref:Uncharacterized protein n=1 Tax=Portunus trituberculatus TaxID=210409 RepID=A0A5B7IBA0_PORTR|nr:hypothetical protein [Portunus trituberculatus]
MHRARHQHAGLSSNTPKINLSIVPFTDVCQFVAEMSLSFAETHDEEAGRAEWERRAGRRRQRGGMAACEEEIRSSS